MVLVHEDVNDGLASNDLRRSNDTTSGPAFAGDERFSLDCDVRRGASGSAILEDVASGAPRYVGTTIAYTGNKGGSMTSLADINVIIPSNTTMNIQESHLALEHIYCMIVERFYFGPDFGKQPQHLAE